MSEIKETIDNDAANDAIKSYEATHQVADVANVPAKSLLVGELMGIKGSTDPDGNPDGKNVVLRLELVNGASQSIFVGAKYWAKAQFSENVKVTDMVKVPVEQTIKDVTTFTDGNGALRYHNESSIRFNGGTIEIAGRSSVRLAERELATAAITDDRISDAKAMAIASLFSS